MGRSTLRCVSWLHHRHSSDVAPLALANPRGTSDLKKKISTYWWFYVHYFYISNKDLLHSLCWWKIKAITAVEEFDAVVIFFRWLDYCAVLPDQSGGETRRAHPGAGIRSEAAGKLAAEAQHAAAQQRHAVPAASRRPWRTQWVAAHSATSDLLPAEVPIKLRVVSRRSKEQDSSFLMGGAGSSTCTQLLILLSHIWISGNISYLVRILLCLRPFIWNN